MATNKRKENLMTQRGSIATETPVIVIKGYMQRTSDSCPVVLNRTLAADKEKGYNDQTSQMLLNGYGPRLLAVILISFFICAFMIAIF